MCSAIRSGGYESTNYGSRHLLQTDHGCYSCTYGHSNLNSDTNTIVNASAGDRRSQYEAGYHFR